MDTYDGGGNRIGAKTTTGSVVSNLTTTYNSRGLPTTASDAVTGESIAYTHDAVGNLTLTDSSVNTNDWAQTFDAYSRMTCAKQATTCASGTTRVLYTFDALDRARTRAYNGTTTTSTYSGISEQLAKTVAGATTTTYAFTPGGHPMAQKVGSAQASYHLLDTHSDVVGLVSSAAANQATTSYDAYGGVLATTGTQGILGYQGDITDAATRQVDMGTRWYAPGKGRFTSRDVLFGELGSPITLNQFAYAGMNPITMWDPTGMMQAGAEGGGYCGTWCEAAQYDYCRAQGIACGSNSYGGTGYTYTPAPVPPQPAPAIVYSGASTIARETGGSPSAYTEQSSSGRTTRRLEPEDIPPSHDPLIKELENCAIRGTGSKALDWACRGAAAFLKILRGVLVVGDFLSGLPTEPRVSRGWSGVSGPNSLHLDSAVPPLTGEACYDPWLNMNVPTC